MKKKKIFVLYCLLMKKSRNNINFVVIIIALISFTHRLDEITQKKKNVKKCRLSIYYLSADMHMYRGIDR